MVGERKLARKGAIDKKKTKVVPEPKQKRWHSGPRTIFFTSTDRTVNKYASITSLPMILNRH